MNNFISIFLLSFILCVQSYAQWQETNLPDSITINTLAVKDSSIFAGTNGDGIFASTDNGENWVSINDGLSSKVIHTIFIDGSNIFAGTEAGASISTNNGLSWNTINSGLSGLGVWSFAVSNFIPGSPIFYEGTWSGVYSSTNNGLNWEATGLSSTTMPVHSIVVHDNYIFAATLGGGLYNSDNGIVWSNISIENTDAFFGITELVPVYSLASIDTNIIAGAGPGYFYRMSTHDTVFVNFYPGISNTKPILCYTVRSATLFAGNSNGDIFSSDPSGLSWSRISPSLKGYALYSLVLNHSYIFAGTKNGVWRLWYPETITNVESLKEVSVGFKLEQNYPNPFNPVTTIKYSIPTPFNKGGTRGGSDVPVQLKVYNLLGQEVATLVNEQQRAGVYEVKFDAGLLPSGIYIYKIQAGNFIEAKKLLLLK